MEECTLHKIIPKIELGDIVLTMSKVIVVVHLQNEYTLCSDQASSLKDDTALHVTASTISIE